MSSSSSSWNRYSHQQVMVVVAAVLSVMSPGVPTTSAAATGICNGESFPDGDARIYCSFALLDLLIGETPVKKGGWYNSQDCSDGSILYGFRFADEGDGSGGCLHEAKNYIAYRDSYHRMGGQAWSAGCYLRFEIYGFRVGELVGLSN
ncbi:unnamed protein product [Linum trigynum]|uniref:Gnk2-homologous domain-containing protein n=1 Tax=Linum trigynum TaxID=586398 RepID=A0AAV2CN46_9ROSI